MWQCRGFIIGGVPTMKIAKKCSHVIWDWNGTLFNDVKWCVKITNEMLAKRNIKILNGVSEYHNAFCFPIKNYYKNIGFDFEKEPFENIAKEYIFLYHSEKTGNCRLNNDAEFVLESIQRKQVRQLILSASEADNLLSQINEFEIHHYFDEILGLSDIYAKSKIKIGLDYLARERVESGLLIGDTEHDYEVANALGVDCLLIATGHQSKEKLLACGVPVLDSLSQVLEYIF